MLSFQLVVIVLTSFIDFFIPDIPVDLRDHVRREAYLTNETIIETEKTRARRKEKADQIMGKIKAHVPRTMLPKLVNGTDGGEEEEDSKV